MIRIKYAIDVITPSENYGNLCRDVTSNDDHTSRNEFISSRSDDAFLPVTGDELPAKRHVGAPNLRAVTSQNNDGGTFTNNRGNLAVYRSHRAITNFSGKMELPGEEPFHYLLLLALKRLGFSVLEAVYARGSIKIRNWKQFPLESICDDVTATIRDVIGSIAEHVTLVIRLLRFNLEHGVESLEINNNNNNSNNNGIGSPGEKTAVYTRKNKAIHSTGGNDFSAETTESANNCPISKLSAIIDDRFFKNPSPSFRVGYHGEIVMPEKSPYRHGNSTDRYVGGATTANADDTKPSNLTPASDEDDAEIDICACDEETDAAIRIGGKNLIDANAKEGGSRSAAGGSGDANVVARPNQSQPAVLANDYRVVGHLNIDNFANRKNADRGEKGTARGEIVGTEPFISPNNNRPLTGPTVGTLNLSDSEIRRVLDYESFRQIFGRPLQLGCDEAARKDVDWPALRRNLTAPAKSVAATTDDGGRERKRSDPYSYDESGSESDGREEEDDDDAPLSKKKKRSSGEEGFRSQDGEVATDLSHGRRANTTKGDNYLKGDDYLKGNEEKERFFGVDDFSGRLKSKFGPVEVGGHTTYDAGPINDSSYDVESEDGRPPSLNGCHDYGCHGNGVGSKRERGLQRSGSTDSNRSSEADFRDAYRDATTAGTRRTPTDPPPQTNIDPFWLQRLYRAQDFDGDASRRVLALARMMGHPNVFAPYANFNGASEASRSARIYNPPIYLPLPHIKEPRPQYPPPLPDCPSDSGTEARGFRKRSRVFIDPLTEIPKLETWFSEDTHPSSYMIEKFTEELNRSSYRQRFPRLEPKNLQLWFKNHRAKVKRSREPIDPSAETDRLARTRSKDRCSGSYEDWKLRTNDSVSRHISQIFQEFRNKKETTETE